MLLRLGKFASINNVFPDIGLDGKFLVQADNVIQNDDLTVKTSFGMTKVKDIQNPHSLWADSDICLLRAGDKLYRVIDNYDLQELKAEIVGNLPMSYLRIGNNIIMMDGINSLVYDGHKVYDFVLPTPPAPSLEVLDGGIIPPGKYRVRLSWVRADGIETPLSDYDEIDLPANKGIRIKLPECSYDNFVKTYVYITERDSGHFYLYQDFLITSNKVDILDFTITKVRPATEGLVSMPTGYKMTLFNSRLFCSEANILYFSEVFDYFHRKALNFLALPEYINDLLGLKNYLMVTTEGGVYTISSNLELKKVYNEPLFKNTARIIDLSSLTFMENRITGIGIIGMSSKGIVVITENGDAFSITESYFNPDFAAGSMSLVEKENYYIIPQ